MDALAKDFHALHFFLKLYMFPVIGSLKAIAPQAWRSEVLLKKPISLRQNTPAMQEGSNTVGYI